MAKAIGPQTKITNPNLIIFLACVMIIRYETENILVSYPCVLDFSSLVNKLLIASIIFCNNRLMTQLS